MAGSRRVGQRLSSRAPVAIERLPRRALAPLRPLAGGEGGARRASGGRGRWVAPPFERAGSPAPHPPPPPNPLPPGGGEGVILGIQHNVATGHSWKLRRRPGSGQSIAASWPEPDKVM